MKQDQLAPPITRGFVRNINNTFENTVYYYSQYTTKIKYLRNVYLQFFRSVSANQNPFVNTSSNNACVASNHAHYKYFCQYLYFWLYLLYLYIFNSILIIFPLQSVLLNSLRKSEIYRKLSELCPKSVNQPSNSSTNLSQRPTGNVKVIRNSLKELYPTRPAVFPREILSMARWSIPTTPRFTVSRLVHQR